MAHSLSKIWIHAIWATKDRIPLINPEIENTLHNLMYREFNEMNCYAKIINGMPDHIHTLFLLNPQKSLSDVIKQVKGSSSYSVNAHNLIPEKFSWQTGYGAFSVSESATEKVILYIQQQKNHHKNKTFEEEYVEFLKLNDLNK